MHLSNVQWLITGASTSAAAVGAGLAQLPGSDWPALVAIQTAMIKGIASEHRVHPSKQMIADLLLTASAAMTGRAISQWVIGWWPGVGNGANATTAASITAAVGWAADKWFAELTT